MKEFTIEFSSSANAKASSHIDLSEGTSLGPDIRQIQQEEAEAGEESVHGQGTIDDSRR